MKTRFTILTLLIGLLLNTPTPAQTNGQIKAVPVSKDNLGIVIPASPTIEESYAAEELQTYIPEWIVWEN